MKRESEDVQAANEAATKSEWKRGEEEKEKEAEEEEGGGEASFKKRCRSERRWSREAAWPSKAVVTSIDNCRFATSFTFADSAASFDSSWDR